MTTDTPGATSELLLALTEDVTTALRHEIERAQRELTGKARQAGRGGALLGAGGALGVMSAGTSAVFVMRIVDRWLPPRSAAFFTTVVLGAGAVSLGAAGWREIRRSVPPTPAEMMSNVRDELDAARAAAPSESPGFAHPVGRSGAGESTHPQG